jgi:hypothetical protein
MLRRKREAEQSSVPTGAFAKPASGIVLSSGGSWVETGPPSESGRSSASPMGGQPVSSFYVNPLQ